MVCFSTSLPTYPILFQWHVHIHPQTRSVEPGFKHEQTQNWSRYATHATHEIQVCHPGPACRAWKLSWYSGFRNKSRHAGHARLEIQCPACRAWKLSWYSGFRNKNQHAGHAKIIGAQASLVRAVSVHSNLRHPGHANFYIMPLTTLNSLSLPL